MSSLAHHPVWPSGLLTALLVGIMLVSPTMLLGEELPIPQQEPLTPQAEPVIQNIEPSAPQTLPVVPQEKVIIPGTEQQGPQAEQLAPQLKEAGSFDAMDARRDYLSGKITGFANYLDKFFGGNRHYQESNASVFQLDMTRVEGYGGNGNFDLAVRFNLRLPVTEGRLRLLVETDPEENISSDPALVRNQPARQKKASTPQSVALAARYATAEENVWHFSLDGGLRFPVPITPFVRTRGSYSNQMGEWRMKVAESVYWFSTTGAGADTQLDMEQVWTASTLFRASANAIWSRNDQNIDLSQRLSIYHTLNDRTVLLYQLGVFEATNPAYQVMDYVALLFCRYRLHQEWLFLELSPQLHFPRVNDFHPSPAYHMRLEALFDESR
jgi:hypothetical protein